MDLLLVDESLEGEGADARLDARVEPAHLGLDGVLREGVGHEHRGGGDGVGGDGAVEHLPVVGVADVLIGEVHGAAGQGAGDAHEPPAGVGFIVVLDLGSVQVDVGGLLAGERDAHGGVAGHAENVTLGGSDHVGRSGCVLVVLRLRRGNGAREGESIDINLA